MDHKVLIISYFYLKYVKNPKRKSKLWVREILRKRTEQGDGQNLIEELRLNDTQYFINYFRMGPKHFDVLLNIVGPQLTKLYCVREPISAKIRLAITLRYLASGDSMMSLAYAYRVGKSTACNIIHHCLQVIWNTLHKRVLLTPSKNMWINIANNFKNTWNFPNCIGAIDGKHIVIQAPEHSGSMYYNYKGQHSIVLMAACSADYLFTLVDIGAQGRMSDGGVFKNSVIGQMLESKEMSLPEPTLICDSGAILPYVFVGDEAFQLTSYMMRPYPRRSVLTNDKRVFNYRLSRARRVIENTFGILVAKWRIFREPLNTNIDTSTNIGKASVCLHNFVKIIENNIPNKQRLYHTPLLTDTNDNNNGEWRISQPSNTMYSVRNVGNNFSSRQANEIRDEFKRFFCNEGAIDWQWERAANADF